LNQKRVTPVPKPKVNSKEKANEGRNQQTKNLLAPPPSHHPFARPMHSIEAANPEVSQCFISSCGAKIRCDHGWLAR
jgi:hypothetical protein